MLVLYQQVEQLAVLALSPTDRSADQLIVPCPGAHKDLCCIGHWTLREVEVHHAAFYGGGDLLWDVVSGCDEKCHCASKSWITGAASGGTTVGKGPDCCSPFAVAAMEGSDIVIRKSMSGDERR